MCHLLTARDDRRMKRDTTEHLLTPREVGETLGFTTARPVYKAIKDGRLPASRIGQRLLIKRADLDKLIERGRVEHKRKRGGLRDLERST
jgi:excisionase family DNA binding protein